MIEKKLGKIKVVKFGYNEYLFGLHFELGGEGWCVMSSYQYNPNYRGEDSDIYLKETIENIHITLRDAKVDSIDKLLNKPVECTFDGNLLKSFRILTEVL